MNNFEFCELLLNIDFWSALSGFVGALLIFFFGLPSKINPEGHINLILEQTDEEAKKRARIYTRISYSGVLLLSISFLLQLLKLFYNY